MKTRDQNKLAIYRCGVTIKFSKNRNIKKISASYCWQKMMITSFRAPVKEFFTSILAYFDNIA